MSMKWADIFYSGILVVAVFVFFYFIFCMAMATVQ
jgi:hypothetical protein